LQISCQERSKIHHTTQLHKTKQPEYIADKDDPAQLQYSLERPLGNPKIEWKLKQTNNKKDLFRIGR